MNARDIAAAAGLVLAACVRSGPASLMDAHFNEAQAVRDAVVAGDLNRAKQAADAIDRRGTVEGVPPEASDQLETLRTYARQVAYSFDISEAAFGLARMARTCGECHRRHAKPLTFPSTNPPAPGSGRAATMTRHAWGADRLWDALIGPSDAEWSQGVAVLVDAPLAPDSLTDNPRLLRDVRAMESRVHDLGRRGATTNDSDGRTRIYADLVSTCAGCHSLVRGGAGREPGANPRGKGLK
jgi:hypothetical protein